MITDIYTIVWKESKEMLFRRAGNRGGLFGVLIMIVMFGVVLPLQFGPQWLSSTFNLLLWSWMPFMLVSSVVADAIAGERERHTLETLLASRLSDNSILFGKIFAATIYGWGLTLLSVLISLITSNIAYWDGHLLFYHLDFALGIIVLSLLVAMLAAGLGVLISLRAATVRQAMQTFSIIFFVMFIPMFLLPMLPASIVQAGTLFVAQAQIDTLIMIAVLFLFIIDLTLLVISQARFQRSRLILD